MDDRRTGCSIRCSGNGDVGHCVFNPAIGPRLWLWAPVQYGFVRVGGMSPHIVGRMIVPQAYPWGSTGFYELRPGFSVFYRSWVSSSATTPLIIVHGGGEHSGRYDNTAAWLNREGLAVYCADLRGHGQSPGVRGHIQRFEEYVDDLLVFVSMVSRQHEGRRPILLGHSLGGLIATIYGMQHAETICCLILTSPLWGLNVPVPLWKRVVARCLSAVWPSLVMHRPTISGDVLSHDPEVGTRYRNDPLVHFKASIRLYTEVTRWLRRLPQVIHHLILPVLVLQGGDDRIASAPATPNASA